MKEKQTRAELCLQIAEKEQELQELQAAPVALPDLTGCKITHRMFGAGTVQPAEGQQHGVHPERQHGKQRITDQCKGQEAPLLPGQPAGLVVGVAQPPEQGELGQHKANGKAAEQRRVAGKLAAPGAASLPEGPSPHQHPGDEIVEGDFLI